MEHGAKQHVSSKSAHQRTRPFFNKPVVPSFFLPGAIQPKLTIGPVDDPYEREADAMADSVMRMPDKDITQTSFGTGIQRKCTACEEEEKVQRKEGDEREEDIQQQAVSNLSLVNRKCSHCEEEEKKLPLQLKAGADFQVQMKCEACEREETENARRKESSATSVPSVTPSVYRAIQSAGTPLDHGTRSFMESRFAYDFSAVRIHDDPLAHQSSTDIHALAYTHGSHIVFASGQYQPHTTMGKKLLAHELTHVIQQSGGVGPRKRRAVQNGGEESKRVISKGNDDAVQCRYTFGPYKRPGGSAIHEGVLPAFVKEINPTLFVEVSIPGANKADVDTGKVGVADFYVPDATNNQQRTIGVKFPDGNPEGLRANKRLQYGGGEYDNAGTAAPKGQRKNPKIIRTEDGPGRIGLGDLKPGFSSESFLATDQIANYKAGILKTQEQVNNYVKAENRKPGSSKIGSWNIQESGIYYLSDLSIPKNLDYAKLNPKQIESNNTGRARLSVWNGESRVSADSGLYGSMFVYKPENAPGVWAYEWIPDNVDGPVENDLAQEALNRLNNDVIPGLRRKQKPTSDDQKQPEPTPVFAYDAWDKNTFTPWQKEATILVKDKQYRSQGDTAAALVGLSEKIPKGKFKVKPETSGRAKAHKKIDHWTKYGRQFGRLRRALGPLYGKVVSFLSKISQKVRAFFATKNDSENVEGDSLIKSVAKTAFTVIKGFIVSLFRSVGQGMMTSLTTGVKNIIRELITTVLGEEFLSKIEELQHITQKIENIIENSFLWALETWFSGAMKVIDMINDIKKIVAKADSIRSTVKWAIRAIQCGTPPGVGCLKLLFSALTEKLIGMAIQSCWFQKEVYLPFFNSMRFLTDLPKRVVERLVGIANEIIPLPNFIKSPLFAAPPAFDAKVKEDDLPCNDDARMNKINIAFAKLEDKYTKEKVKLLMDILKKRGVGEKTDLDLNAIGLLDNALHELESVNDATLMAILDDEPDKQNAVPTALEEFIQNVKQVDRSLFALDDGGAVSEPWFMVGHLPLVDGKIDVTFSKAQRCKDWHPFAKMKIRAAQLETKQFNKKTKKISFKALETLEHAGMKVEKDKIFWAWTPDSCEKLKGTPSGKQVRRKTDSSGDMSITVSPSTVLNSTGRKMDRKTLSFMQQRFDYNFDDVHIHDNAGANRSAREIHALAYTHGHDIVFGSGQYQPDTPGGRRLLAHELTHVVQQQKAGIGPLQRQPAPPVTIEVQEANLRKDFLDLRAIVDATSPNDTTSKRQIELKVSKFVKDFAEYHPKEPRHVVEMDGPNPYADYWKHSNVYSISEANSLSARLQLIGLVKASQQLYQLAAPTTLIGVFAFDQPDEFFGSYAEAVLERIDLSTPAKGNESIDLLLKAFNYISNEIAKLDPAKIDKSKLNMFSETSFFFSMTNRLGAIYGGMQRVIQNQMDTVVQELDATGESPTIVKVLETLKKIERETPRAIKFIKLLAGAEKFVDPTESNAEVTRSKFTDKGGVHEDYFNRTSTAPTVKIEYYDKTQKEGKEKTLPIAVIHASRYAQLDFIKTFYGLDDAGKHVAGKDKPNDLMGVGKTLKLFSTDDWRDFLSSKFDNLTQKQKQSPANAFMDLVRLIQSYMKAFTIHTPYNIDDFGDNYLTQQFPRALTGQLIHDCGVYALKTVYLLSLVSSKLKLKFQYIVLPNHVGLIITGENIPVFIVHNDLFSVFPMDEAQFDALTLDNKRVILNSRAIKAHDDAKKNPDAAPIFTMDKLKEAWLKETKAKGLKGSTSDEQFLAEQAANLFVPKTDIPFAIQNIDAKNFDSKLKTEEIKKKMWAEYTSMVRNNALFDSKALNKEGSTNQFNLRYLNLTVEIKDFNNQVLLPFWNIKARAQWSALEKQLAAFKKRGDVKGFIDALKVYQVNFRMHAKEIFTKYDPIGNQRTSIHEIIKSKDPDPLKKGAKHTVGERGWTEPWQSALDGHDNLLTIRIQALETAAETLDKGTDITPGFASENIPYYP